MTNFTDTQIALLEAAHGDATVLKFQSLDELEAELEKIEEEIDIPGHNEKVEWYSLRSVAVATFNRRFLVHPWDIAAIIEPGLSSNQFNRFGEDYLMPGYLAYI